MILIGKPASTQRVKPEGTLFRIMIQSAAERIALPDGYRAMKEHRLNRPALAVELLLALAASLVAGTFAWYAVLLWRFFLD